MHLRSPKQLQNSLQYSPMQIEKLILQNIQQKIFFVTKKQSAAASIFNFGVAAATGLLAIMCYNEQIAWQYIAGFTLCSIIYATHFFFGTDYLQLYMPCVNAPLKLYKIDDVFFVGYSIEEAQLFAALANKQDSFVEEFENPVYTFEQ